MGRKGEGVVEHVGVAEGGGWEIGGNKGKKQNMIQAPPVQGRAVKMFHHLQNQMMIMCVMFVEFVGAVTGLLVTHAIFGTIRSALVYLETTLTILNGFVTTVNTNYIFV